MYICEYIAPNKALPKSECTVYIDLRQDYLGLNTPMNTVALWP